MRRRFQNGFTLIEVMVAMVVLSIGLLGLAGITVVVLRSNLLSQQISDATTIATDMMEGLKRQSVSSLTACPAGSFLTAIPSSCPILSDSGLSGQTAFYPPNTNGSNTSCGITGITKYPTGMAVTNNSSFDTSLATLQGGQSAPDTQALCTWNPTLAQREYIRWYRITDTAGVTNSKDLAVVVAWKDKFGKWRNIRLSTTKTQ